MKRFLTVLALCLCSSYVNAAPAADTNAPVVLDTIRSMDGLDDQQKLGPGDRLIYRVVEDQDEPRPLTVTDTGDLDVPYFGLIRAAGKTSQQLAKEVKAKLEKKLYRQATVIIALDVANRTRVLGKVYVTGQVRNSGAFDIPAGESLTVSKAVLLAGGFSDFSDKKNVRLIRKAGKDKKTLTVNVINVWEKGKLEDDLEVKPNDTIVVPARLVNY